MTNGNPFGSQPVPDLAALQATAQGADPAHMIERAILEAVGTRPGGRVQVTTGPAEEMCREIDGIQLLIVFGPGGVQILGVRGTQLGYGSRPVFIPWHDVTELTAVDQQ